MGNIIEVRNLVKKYKIKKNGEGSKERTVLKGISFDVQKGEVLGLLGPNGAGKSTTFKILTTLLTPTSGDVYVLGKDVKTQEKQIRENINFIFGGERGVYTNLTAKEYLAYFCNLYKIPKKNIRTIIEELIDLVGLSESHDKKIETFSKGMIQRLHIARSLINKPKVLFLDEPTIGLDPVGAKILRNIVKDLSKKGITIIITTHYMQEAEELCDKIAFIKHGEIIECGYKDEILNSYKHLNIYEITMRVLNIEDLVKDNKLYNMDITELKENIYYIKFSIEDQMREKFVKKTLEKYGDVIEIKKKLVTLEDIYLEIMAETR